MAKLIWKRTGRRVSKEGTDTIYTAAGTSFTIESRKRHIPHANGVGTWDHTTYVVVRDGEDVIEKQSLKDAKSFVEMKKTCIDVARRLRLPGV